MGSSFISKLFTALLLFLSVPAMSLAQVENGVDDSGEQNSAETTAPLREPGQETLPNTVSCFDYYQFGSIQVDIESSVEGTVSGVPLSFSGRIVNNNPYPVVHGQLLVKIYKTTAAINDDIYQNGYPVVDQFFALEDVTIPANSSVPIDFDWQVPDYLVSGEYELNTFFMTEKRFNLLGLPFTDDVTGNKLSFTVAGQAEGSVAFNKNSVTLNTQSFKFATFPLTFSATETVTVTAQIENTTTEVQTIPVTWTLYNWAGERVENKLDTKTETVSLLPGESSVVSYDAVVSTGAISFVQAIATYQDVKSILNIRFIREGAHEIRLNFPSILSYPLVVDQEATIFSCVHSTSQPLVPGSKLVLTVADSAGEVVNTYTYEGGVTGAMMGVKNTFTPERTLTDFTLTASLFNGNQLVEEVVQKYSCLEIDPTTCVSDTASSTSLQKSGMTLPLWQKVLGVVSVLLLAVMIWLLKRRRDAVQSSNWDTSTTDIGMFLVWGCVIGSSVVSLCLPTAAWAKSATTYINSIPPLYHNIPVSSTAGNLFYYGGVKWWLGIDAGAAQITYKAEVEDVVTDVPLTSNAALPVGAKIRVHQINRLMTDISWHGTGFAFDSPYGRWMTDAANPPTTCWSPGGLVATGLKAGNWMGWNYGSIFAYLSVHPPEPVVVPVSDNLSCTGNICTVTAVGPINVEIHFPKTEGKYYFRYKSYDTGGVNSDLNQGQCYSSASPMRSYGSGSSYVMPVAAQVIPFNFRAVAQSAPPSAPVIIERGANSNTVSEVQSFSITSTDLDGDQLKYGIDWDNNGSVDQWAPVADYVVTPGGVRGYKNSGDAVFPVHKWINAGQYTFRAIAVDTTGTKSKWSEYTIQIRKPQPAVVLIPDDCIAPIPVGGTSCVGRVQWQYSNAAGPYLVTNKTTSKTIGVVVTGNKDVTLTGGDNIIEAFNNGKLLDTQTVNAGCVAGATWYLDACVNAQIPDITLIVTQPIVRMHATTTVRWNISNIGSNTCTLRIPGGQRVPVTTSPGELVVGPITSRTTLELVCTSPVHDPVKATADIEVIPTVTEN